MATGNIHVDIKYDTKHPNILEEIAAMGDNFFGVESLTRYRYKTNPDGTWSKTIVGRTYRPGERVSVQDEMCGWIWKMYAEETGYDWRKPEFKGLGFR